MTPDDSTGQGGAPPADDDGLGEPLVELRDLSLGVDARFGQRLRGTIERRLLVGGFLDLAWTTPMMLFELLRAPFELFGRRRRP